MGFMEIYGILVDLRQEMAKNFWSVSGFSQGGTKRQKDETRSARFLLHWVAFIYYNLIKIEPRVNYEP